VESIKDHRIDFKEGLIEFLVKWKDYDDTDNTWESFYMFSQDQPDLV